jgi:hypothetical protein
MQALEEQQKKTESTVLVRCKVPVYEEIFGTHGTFLSWHLLM